MSKGDDKGMPHGADNDDDRVGYRRPPKEHQFKPGQSGNRRGRPPKVIADTDLAADWGSSTDAMGRIAFEPVSVTLNGRQTTIPAIEAVQRRRLNDAMRGGNRLLQREVIAEANAAKKHQIEREVQDYLHLRDLKAAGEARIAEAKKRGLPEPRLLPHPGDIIIDEESITATIIGPETEEERVSSDYMLALRDHFVLRAVYQERFPPLLGPLPADNFENWKKTAEGYNELLCPRLRWGRGGFWAAAQPLQRRGFRFMESDMETSLHKLHMMWFNEPVFKALHKQKKVAAIATRLLSFRTRGRERRLWQSQCKLLHAILREAYGDEYVAKLPKRASLPPSAERMAEFDALPPEERARYENVAAKVLELGPFRRAR